MYFLTFQDPELSDKIRNKAGIPLLFISHNAIMLEAPSEKTKQRASRDVADRMEQDHKNLIAMKKHVLGEEDKVKKKKRKGPKGPNPLSCKKAKPKGQSVADGKVTKRKRKRHRRGAHIPDHVKEQLVDGK